MFHDGVKGNEHTDRLADIAVVKGGIEMDHTDNSYVLRDSYTVSEAANNSESTTMIRLNELHVNASARQQQYAGKQRRIVNQHNTLTVSCYTLMELLKEKSELMDMTDVQGG
jgi:hypothetical protein